MNSPDAAEQTTAGIGRLASLLGGPLLAAAVFLLLPDSYTDTSGAARDFTVAGRCTTAVAAWMAVWWLTEAVNITVTALLPIALFPLLGARSIGEATAPYAHRLIFLFMGGFIIALAMERWGLHRRIALKILTLVGTRTRNMVGGFMLVTAALSMWISNTATTLMMLPIALSVVELVTAPASGGTDPGEGTRPLPAMGAHFAVCLLLGIAYAASIGGIGTVIGTPPNLFLVSYIEKNLGQEISFARWLGVGLPVTLVFLPITWLVLCRFVYPIRVERVPGGAELIRRAYAELGPMRRGECLTLVVFLITAVAWISRIGLQEIPILAGLSDPGIAMIAALTLFVLPVEWRRRRFVMDWETAVKLPWGTLLLFGGGLSLSAAIQENGVGSFVAAQVGALRDIPGPVLTLLLVTLVIFLTELTSNLATTATIVPVLAGVAVGLDLHPFTLIVPATVAASCAFMMPVATPPNAVIYGSGKVRIGEMIRAGFWLNIIGIALVTLLSYAVILPLLVE